MAGKRGRRRVRDIVLLGKTWKLIVTRLRGKQIGYCSPPWFANPKRKIWVHDDADDKAYLTAILHECLHGLNWWAAEEWIEDGAEELAQILIDEGFHRRSE